MAQVIMVASGKGGTGKSTVSTLLATELALLGHKTFLTELDSGLRSIDVISGISEMAVYDIGDVLAGSCSVEKAMVNSPYTDKLSIVMAPYKSQNISFDGLKKVIDRLYDDFEYIIIDTAAGVGKAFEGALKVSQRAIIVANADGISVRDARVVSDEIYNYGISDIRLVVNKFDKNTFKFSGFYDLDQVIDFACAQLLGVVPSSEQIAVCTMNGNLLPEQSKEKQIITAIAKRILGYQQQIVFK